MRNHRWLPFLLLWLLVLGALSGHGAPVVAAPAAQEVNEPVEALLAAMTPAQRVGQLFLVTFNGSETGPESMAYRLVRELNVGGVALRASNRNFINGAGTPESVATLTQALQTLSREGSEAQGGPFVPLFVGVDLFSDDPVLADGPPQAGFTPLPSQMTIGATWRAENGTEFGRIVGQELAAVGINLLLGPALDVVDAPRPGQENLHGSRTFGGDPYWVSQLGKYFVRGVQEGSGNQVAAVARHFPGLGSSDRRADEEIATVQKPLQALQQEDLPPFFAVTNIGELTATVDGLMTTNLRYRGLQGNIRQITRPISLDAQNLPALVNLAELQPWRQAGGVLVSDELGAPALRRFYRQQTNTNSFPALIVAEDAFKAGNDLLFLADFAIEEEPAAQLVNIEATVAYFTEQYINDPVFASNVDASLRRLLAVKLGMYGAQMDGALAPPAALDPAQSPLRSQENMNAIARIAQESATLLFPGAEELADRLPGPPLPDENILIVTDARTVRDCAVCLPRPLISQDALASFLVARYGPTSGSGRIDPERITNLSFDTLYAVQTGAVSDPGQVAAVQEALAGADWLIFLMQDVSPAVPSSEALRLFLRDLGNSPVRERKLIVFSFAAPYFLDSTEISKVTAYYSFYTPADPFVDAAARLLFKEYSASGRPPVSIYPYYSLEAQLSPATEQVVEICLDAPDSLPDDCVPVSFEDVQAGGELPLRTTVIQDRNGNPVPDGTVVNFIMRYPNENNLELPRRPVLTVGGVARALIPLNREGQLNISVSSEPPTFESATVLVTIQGSDPPTVATQLPPTATPAPTVTPSPTATRTPSPTPAPATATPVPLPEPEPITRFGQANEGFGWWALLGSVAGLVLVGGLGAVTSSASQDMLMERILKVLLVGMGAYVLYLLIYAFRLVPANFDGWGAVVSALIGGLIAMFYERG